MFPAPTRTVKTLAFITSASPTAWTGEHRAELVEVKNGLILPTGQWYDPSAVINDAWYCLALHGIALCCTVLHGTTWYCMVWHLALSCTILQ